MDHRVQSWTMDAFGNWTGFVDERPYLQTSPSVRIVKTPFEWTGQYTPADQHQASSGLLVDQEFITTPPGPPADVTPHYDASGNLIDDGKRFAFEYDARNQLVAVYWRDPAADEEGEGYRGALYARYTYNGLRTSD